MPKTAGCIARDRNKEEDPAQFSEDGLQPQARRKAYGRMEEEGRWMVRRGETMWSPG
jgi:hypothetical protein